MLLLLLCSLSTTHAAPLTLVDSGQPKATIVIAAQAGDKVKVAADDLQLYLRKLSGATLPIVTDDQEVTGSLVLVGRSKLTDGMKLSLPSGLTPARREEGFAIIRKGQRLVLAGDDEGPYHGTEYAVYEFLNRLGVRWFMPGDFGGIVPSQTTIAVPEIEVREKPDFVMRNWWLHAKPELAELERRWKIRNKMNPDGVFATPGDSSVRNLLPEAMFKEHPDWFALNPDGTRNPYHPNLTDPNTVRMCAEIIKDYLRKNPEANSYGFAPDDGFPRDYSPDTVALNRGFVELGGRPGVPAEVSTSEEWFTFVNNVTREVRREFPAVYIATNGYANRDLPPQGIPLDDHLVIMFAAIWSCTLHGYDDEHCWQKVRQGEMLRRWCELCPNVWIYGYNYQMLVSGLTPIPEIHKLRRDFPLMKKWGVMGFLDENRNVWAEAGIASRYLRARLEWDADTDVDALLEDFYTAWYGPAAGPMRAFYDALDQAFEQTAMHGHEDRVLPEVYTLDLLATLRRHLREGERAADADPFKTRVRADRLIYDHLVAYVAMSAAEAEGDFAAAAKHAQEMLDLRPQLHAISPFFIWPDEDGYHTGVWYWRIIDRRNWYQSLADKVSGKIGRGIALLPRTALSRTDPHDDGLTSGWYQPQIAETDWARIDATRPFYAQGYEDERGHTYLGYLWYRLGVNLPPVPQGRKVMLYVPVIETEAWCWVNGQYVGQRPYLEAYIRPAPMELDVTNALRPGPNAIAIRVSTSLAAAQAADGMMGRAFLYSPRPGQ